MKIKVMNDLHNLEYIFVTADAWTSRSALSYLTITAHGLNCHWNLISRVLQTKEFKQPHTGEKIKDIIR